MKHDVIGYSSIAKIFHWSSALLVFALFALGYWMVGLDYYSEWYQTAPFWHKSLGLLLAFFTLLRLSYKCLSTSPELTGKAWERHSAKWVHRALYLLLFTIFISGYLISTADGRSISVFDLFSLPSMGKLFDNQEYIAGEIHYYATYATIACALLHALAALKHHFINQDSTLKKML